MCVGHARVILDALMPLLVPLQRPGIVRCVATTADRARVRLFVGVEEEVSLHVGFPATAVSKQA